MEARLLAVTAGGPLRREPAPQDAAVVTTANNEDATAFTLRRPVMGIAGRVPADTSGTRTPLPR